jgi:hypothetical protein
MQGYRVGARLQMLGELGEGACGQLQLWAARVLPSRRNGGVGIDARS